MGTERKAIKSRILLIVETLDSETQRSKTGYHDRVKELLRELAIYEVRGMLGRHAILECLAVSKANYLAAAKDINGNIQAEGDQARIEVWKKFQKQFQQWAVELQAMHDSLNRF